MNAVKMNRVTLLGIVRENKLKHTAAYLESVNDYKQLIVQVATNNLTLAQSGNLADFAKIKAAPGLPQSYESSYARAIRMLELSVDDIIDVEEDVFNQLVLDEWHWKNSFVTAGAMYKSMY
jgi:hypothetical protein